MIFSSLCFVRAQALLSAYGFLIGFTALGVLSSGCSLIDDFSEFRIVRDAGDDDAGTVDTRDAAVPLCGGEDCSRLNGPCSQGECIDDRCVATPIRDGRSCGPDLCTVCNAGECSAPKDCSEYDGPCTRGVCNPSDGVCSPTNINEGRACFDNEPCTVNETCVEGSCSGVQRDCSNFDDQCSTGVCERETGLCTYGMPNSSSTCDDFNPCTTNDRCDASGRCVASANAIAGAPCNDYNACTGTLISPDVCDGSGVCEAGANVTAGTTCNDDNECTDPDRCNGNGVCTGPAVREGQACEVECKDDNTCRGGACLDANEASLGYKAQCYFNWCDSESLCQDRWQRDDVCDCGCGFIDSACDACSPRMCEADPSLMHRAAKWCDARGQAIDLCPDSLKEDGKCDCGCQFVDPDCGGGSCCSATGRAGCGDAFIENCVCERQGAADADPSCCNGRWTEECAQRAVQLGCMVCP